jgi:hypothetical protein
MLWHYLCHFAEWHYAVALCVILKSIIMLRHYLCHLAECHYAVALSVSFCRVALCVSFCCVFKMPGVVVSRRDLRFSLFLKSEQETKKKWSDRK